MCGIVGLIDTTAKAVSRDLITKMRDAMRLRGPDGAGEFFDDHIGMAMRRLSVIDLERGWQPLFSRGDQVVVFQNGEIYNYRQLRKELEAAGFTFTTNSDTEVLAHGFVHWGIEGLLEQADGMFSLAVLDRMNRTLHLARDRFGEKPLYYCSTNGRFAYSSNLLTLAALPWVDAAIDPASIDRYLALHYIPGDRTVFRGVHRLLPGNRLIVPLEDPVPRRFRFYRVDPAAAQVVDDEALASRMEHAVTSRMIADVPIGIFLSGGVDSSLVAAIAANHAAGINTFSVGFSSRTHDESEHARQVARIIGSTHHHFLFDEPSFHELLPGVAGALDEPVGDQALLPLYVLCREAKKHVTVALSGEGADEIFAGYDYYQRFVAGTLRGALHALGKPWRHTDSGRLFAERGTITRSGFPLVAAAKIRERLLGQTFGNADEWETELFKWLEGVPGRLRQASIVDMDTWLADDLLVKLDRMSMAHSLEARSPYLEAGLVHLGVSLPPSQRMSARVGKIALRRIARRWLPDTIINRPKHGFTLPLQVWIDRYFAMHGGIRAYFRDHELPCLDARALDGLDFGGSGMGHGGYRLAFALVLLAEWHRASGQRIRSLREHRG